MKFTLSFNDYVEHYLSNIDRGIYDLCPVCYEDVLSGGIVRDLSHIYSCRQESIILYKLENNLLSLPLMIDDIDIDIVDMISTNIKQCDCLSN